MNKAEEPSEAAATANGWEFGHHCPDISWRSHKCPGLHQPFFFGWHGFQLQLVDSLHVKSMGDLMPLGEYCLPSSNVFSHHCPDVLTYWLWVPWKERKCKHSWVPTARKVSFRHIDHDQYIWHTEPFIRQQWSHRRSLNSNMWFSFSHGSEGVKYHTAPSSHVRFPSSSRPADRPDSLNTYHKNCQHERLQLLHV